MAVKIAARRAELVSNLVKLYNRDTDTADVESGLTWYPYARRIVREWSATYGYSVPTVACVIAAISPQCEWSRNLIIADDVLADRAISIGGALHANIAKARRILEARAEDTIAFMPYGPKVASFARNLAGSDTFVTVDTHAAQAALDDVRSTLTLNWPRYAVVAEAYALAAVETGHSPANFQAIIWHTWKRLNPRIEKIRKRSQWAVMGEF